LGSLFELRREQNLYANPKRTAKSFACHTDIDAPEMQMVQKNKGILLTNCARFFGGFEGKFIFNRPATTPANLKFENR
jgi:hypothetical protein